MLEHHAQVWPNRVLAIAGDRSTSYGEMYDQSCRLAAGLAELGVGAGDVVGILMHNHVEMLEVMFAANALGAIAMPINWRLAADEVAYILGHSGSSVLFFDEACAEQSAAAAEKVSERTVTRVAVATSANGGASCRSIEELRDYGVVTPRTNAGSDLHRLMYTSGTTSRPKGVMITHENLMWKNIAHVVELGFSADDVGLVVGPLYHVGALDLTATTLIYAGARLVIEPRFDARAAVEAIERYRATTTWLAPAMINLILNLPDLEKYDLSSMRVIIDGGEKMPLPLIGKLHKAFPEAWFADAYGLTETVGGDTYLDKGKLLDRLGSVGRPCLHVEIDIWDDDGRPVPPRTEGEIVIRGPKVFPGYWKNEEATKAAFVGGWFHSGDVGYLDEDGFLYISDRLKDMIKSGGENIASPEVERVLYEHPAVLEAAVVGRPDDQWGEVPIAFVVLREGVAAGEEDLVAHCKERLARFKAPKEVRFMDALPRNPSGKILKRELRVLL